MRILPLAYKGSCTHVLHSVFSLQLDGCDPEDPDQEGDDSQQSDETQSWIGIIHIPVLEYYNARQGSKSCSVLDRVCITHCLHLEVCPLQV